MMQQIMQVSQQKDVSRILEWVENQWSWGDWQSLNRLSLDLFQNHPQRAKLALLAAASQFQTGNKDEARQLVRLAQAWGAGRELIGQILTASVHESLGRAAAFDNQPERALQHFQRALARSVTDATLLARLRMQCLFSSNTLASSVQVANQSAVTAPTVSETTSRQLYAVLAGLHQIVRPRFYLEIGIGNGDALALARCKSVGVDPVAQEWPAFGPNVHIFQNSSDVFFAQQADIWLHAQPLDFVLIAGIPLMDYVLRDLIALESWAQPYTLVAIPGIFPPTQEASTRHRTSCNWCGDVWRLPGLLREFCPDLQLIELDVEPAGLLLITGFSPKNQTLTKKYQQYVECIKKTTSVPNEILKRTTAKNFSSPMCAAFLEKIYSLKS